MKLLAQIVYLINILLLKNEISKQLADLFNILFMTGIFFSGTQDYESSAHF